MRDIAHLAAPAEASSFNGWFAADTAILVFFLGINVGQGFTLGFETILAVATLAMFAVLPYFLPYEGSKPEFEGWVVGRIALALAAVVLGVFLDRTFGSLMPAYVRFIPLTLVMLAGMVSTFIQLANLMRIRLVK